LVLEPREANVKILVSAKRVTDPDARIRLKADLSGIESEGLEYKLNPFCENAIEEALRIQETQGAEVVAVCIGDEKANSELVRAMAMGADRSIRVEGRDVALDSDLVARIFAKLAEREKPDLILLGKQAVDGDSNQVGQLLAEYLGWGQATFVSHPKGSAGMTSPEPGLKVAGGTVQAMREVDGGTEIVEVALPAVVTADLRLNEPRLPKLPNIIKAKRKPLQQVSMAELGVDPALKVKTVRYSNPPERKAGVKVATVEDLVSKLVNEAKVL